jgi:hypothetical protein
MNAKLTQMAGRLARTGAAVLAAALLSGGLTNSAQAAPPFASPVGTWDFTMTGPREGVGLITFSNDNTLSVLEIIVPKPHHGSNRDFNELRNVGDNETRTGFNVSTNTGLPAHTNIIGAELFPQSNDVFIVTNILTVVSTNVDITSTTNIAVPSTNIVHLGHPAGHWGFDSKGRVTGFFTEFTAPYTLLTNPVPVLTNVFGPFTNIFGITNVAVSNSVSITNVTFTNFLGFVTNIVYETNITGVRLTNAISFTGLVVPGQRVTLKGSTPAGIVMFHGVPPAAVLDVSGTWHARKYSQGLVYNETFDAALAPAFFAGSFNNYIIVGTGPGYDYAGLMIVSRQKRFGFVADIFATGEPIPNNIPIRATTGPINLGRPSFTSRGEEGFGGSTDVRLRFDAARDR